MVQAFQSAAFATTLAFSSLGGGHLVLGSLQAPAAAQTAELREAAAATDDAGSANSANARAAPAVESTQTAAPQVPSAPSATAPAPSAVAAPAAQPVPAEPQPHTTDRQSRFVYAAAIAGLIAGGIIASRRKK